MKPVNYKQNQKAEANLAPDQQPGLDTEQSRVALHGVAVNPPLHHQNVAVGCTGMMSVKIFLLLINL